MRRRLPLIQRNVARSTSLPAPVGGWNARDSLGEMKPADAVILQNWFPATTYLQLRSGYTQWASGLSGQCESVMAYNGLTTNKLFAASDGNIYDASSGGAVGAAVQSGLTNARWQHVVYQNSGGNYLYIVNGADAPRYYNGSTWTTPAISGATASKFIHVNAHKARLWFVEKASLSAWYLGVNAISGTATKFDLTGIARRGGYLMAMATWTVDAGYGVDDLAVFITSQGDVLVYRGFDPASTWSLVGVWELGAPVGRRCFVKYAGDLLILTQDGVVPMSAALQSSRVNPRVALTDKIQYAVSQAVSNYSSNFGWQLIPYPAENMLFLNVPVGVGSQQQYVMNTISKSWCNFTGWAANAWELWNDQLYWGGDGFVGRAWNGVTDNGTAITGDALQAFSSFGSPGLLKRWTMIRPYLMTDGTPAIYGNLNIDFDMTTPTATLSAPAITAATWDSGLWDAATWGGGMAVQRQWQGANGVGYWAAPRILAQSSNATVQWIATDVVLEPGAIL